MLSYLVVALVAVLATLYAVGHRKVVIGILLYGSIAIMLAISILLTR